MKRSLVQKMVRGVLLFQAVSLSTGFAHAAGVFGGSTGVGGGGDADEITFISIENDIRSWITNGGSQYLVLPAGVTLATYNQEMLALLDPHAVVVGFTPNDVSVDATPKTCRGFISPDDQMPHVLCNIARWEATANEMQYPLVHHEIAGLAGLEQNIGGSSDYEISNQLTEFLEVVPTLKLGIKAPPGPSGPFDPNACQGDSITEADALKFFQPGATLSTLNNGVVAIKSRHCNTLTGCQDWTPIQGGLQMVSCSTAHNGDCTILPPADLDFFWNISFATQGGGVLMRVSGGIYDMSAPLGSVIGAPVLYGLWAVDWQGSTRDSQSVQDSIQSVSGNITSHCAQFIFHESLPPLADGTYDEFQIAQLIANFSVHN